MSLLIEYKLRRYFNLGHKLSLYMPQSLRKQNSKNHDETIGIQIIEKIVNKNNINEINSIVPIILKIKQENKLHDHRYLIFILSVCTRFNLETCKKMVSDAYAAVLLICTDGLKLLMFVKFCEIASEMMYKIPLTFDDEFKKAMENWYLNKQPIVTTQDLVYHKRYYGWTHKKIMKLIDLKSDNTNQQIFITHTMFGMKEVEKQFQYKFNIAQIININDDTEFNEFKSIYIFLKQLNELKNMNKQQLIKEIELNRWKSEVIPKNMVTNKEILIALIKRMPLRMVLDQTFYFSKIKFFQNNTFHNGVGAYILRFNDTLELKESKIHPIESFIEFAKYTRTSLNIARMQKKERTIFNTKLNIKKKVLIQVKKNKYSKPNNSSHDKDTLQDKDTKNEKNSKDSSSNDCKQLNKKENNTGIQSNLKLIPAPKLVKELATFLSDDLIKRTLKVLKPFNARIIIAFDCRSYMRLKQCEYSNLVTVHEAITLIILSLIYPNVYNNKPTLRGLNEKQLLCINQMKIDYSKHLTFSTVESALFKTLPSHLEVPPDNYKTRLVYPLTTLEWAKENKKKYDVFIFLGTTQMKFSNIKEKIKDYQDAMNVSSKFIVCCLNGRLPQQTNLSRDKMLFITGFDKNVGRLINSFINNEF